jgi:zinc protease
MKSVKHSLLTVVFAFTVSSIFSQPTLVEKVEAKAGEKVIAYEKWKMPNGLTILLHEDHSDPIVHVEVTYHVGSSRESPGKSGFAHFFEHMMFQGSDNVEDEEHFKIVSGAGGNMNGTTNRDRTNYFETVPSNYLETALWLEADRMGFLVDAVTEKKFENQRSTVKNEKGQNYLNVPYGTVGEVNDQNLYPAGHPYSWPTIGYTDDLDSSNLQDLRNFFLRWYGPNNAILTIAGDFVPERALKWVQKYFGSIPAGPVVKKLRVDRPILASDQYATIEDAINLPLTQFTFSSVPLYHKDEPALDMLASIMGGDNNSLFYKNFVKEEKAVQAAVFNPCFELAGQFTIQIVAFPSEELEETDKLIRSTIDQFEKEVLKGPGIAEELKRAKSTMTSQLIDVMQSVQGKASSLTSWEMLMPGRKFNLDQDLARYNAVTKEDLVMVFNKYIKGKKAAVVNVIPKPYDPSEDPEDRAKKVSFNPNAGMADPNASEYEGLTYNKAKDDFDRSVQPSPTAAIPARIPKYYKETFSNGLKVIGTNFKEFPKVSMLMEIKGGHLLEEDMNHGVGALTASLMNEGTVKYSTEEITAELAKLGSVINFSSGTDNSRVVVQCLEENLDQTLALFEEMLLHPRFDPKDFKRVKKQTLEAIKNQRTSAALTANKAFFNVLYGNTILGSYFTGTYESVDKIDLDEVKAYYAKAYSPTVSNIVVVGPVTKEEIVPKLSFLKNWEKKEVTVPEFTKADFPKYEGTQVMLIDRPGAPQSEIRIGHLGHKFDYKGEHFKSTVMNFSLGGAFNSRINLNLREDKGFTYGARSFFTGGHNPGVFIASAGVRTSATDSAIVEFMKEINTYKTTGITNDELSFTKSSLLQRDILNYESPFQKANFLSNILEYNLPDSYVAEQQDVLSSLTQADINKLAKEQLKPDEMVILVVGNAYVVKKKMEELGYGKVKELDAKNIKLKEFKK